MFRFFAWGTHRGGAFAYAISSSKRKQDGDRLSVDDGGIDGGIDGGMDGGRGSLRLSMLLSLKNGR